MKNLLLYFTNPKSMLASFPKFMMSAFLALTCIFHTVPAQALSAVADTGASFPGIGYGAQILDLVLKNWENPDKTATGTTSITLRIAKDGRPFSCETRAFSSSKITDNSLCDTVAKIGTFPPHLGTQNTEIILTFVHEPQVVSPNLSATNTAENISNQAQPNQQPQQTQQAQRAQQAQQVPPSAINSAYHTPPQVPQNSATANTDSSDSLSAVGSSLIGTQSMQHRDNQSPQTIPSLVPETAPSPSQEELQENHTLATQSMLSSGQVSSLTDTNTTPPTLTQESPVPPLTPALSEEELKKNHELQREITREEALAPPSENLVLPEKAMEAYSRDIFLKARTLVRPPNNIEKGTYSTVARIDIEGSGALQNVSVQKSSGNKELDDAVISVLKNQITYPPTPNQDPQTIWLTFTIKK